jgi:hypothetical protein
LIVVIINLSNNPILVGVKDLILEPNLMIHHFWGSIPLHQRKLLGFFVPIHLLKILAPPSTKVTTVFFDISQPLN